MTEKTAELHPVNRVRQETLRGFLKGLKALLEEGCVIKRVHVVAVSGDELKRRAKRLGELRRGAGEATAKRAPKKPGAKVTRPRKPGESEADKKKRLSRERAQRYRARKKQAASSSDKPKGRKKGK